MPSLVSLSTSSPCPPCASAFLARRSSERGCLLLHVLIAGHCKLCAGLIFLLRHQRATRGSVEQGPGDLASRAPFGCRAPKLLQLSCSAGCQVQITSPCAFWKAQIWWELYLASGRQLLLLPPALRGEVVVRIVWSVARLHAVKVQDPGECSVQGTQNPVCPPLRQEESPHSPSHHLVCDGVHRLVSPGAEASL